MQIAKETMGLWPWLLRATAKTREGIEI